MTTAADDRADEDAFEALLAGRPAPVESAGLAAFTVAVRDSAASPGRPSAALADLLRTGLLTDQSSPSARTAPTAGTARSRSRTRRRLPVIVPALIAKFLSAGALAQAAAGAGVVVVVTAGAGTAGVLPPGAQTAFAKVTGGEVAEEDTGRTAPTDVEDDGSPDPGDPTAGDGETAGIAVEGSDDLGDAAKAEADWVLAAKSVDSQKAFKEWLAEGKAEGWVTGQAVRDAVQARNAARDRAREAERALEDTPEGTTPEAEDEASQDEALEDEASQDEALEDEASQDEAEDEVEDRDDDSGEHEAEDRSDEDRGEGKDRGRNGKGGDRD